MAGLSVAERAAVAHAQKRSGARSVILVAMNGGASQLETFDPKPDAASNIRGPLRTIQTALPGVYFSEALPMLAQRAARFSVVRSVHHDAAPIHEAGHQLLYSGRLASRGLRPASLGSAVSRLLGPRRSAPAYVMLPGPVRATGVTTDCGGGAGWLGDAYAPRVMSELPAAESDSDVEASVPAFDAEPATIRERYGENPFGRLLWQAGRLVEAGVRVVVVNLCPKLEGEITWDAHASKSSAPATLCDYRDTLGPQFDRGCAALLDDLADAGLLEDTLVLCTGEFGRTPRLNANGGRDHWPHCWSALVAGGGIAPGRVVGASDARGEYPIEAPVSLPQLAALAYHVLRLDPRSPVALDDASHPLLEVDPPHELVSA